ncbi:FKBP-type peptidyl-prolyl cis-trans isomerase [Sphingobacterium kyonggiense]
MKQINLLFIVLFATMAMSSCMKNDIVDNSKDREKEQARIDSTFDAQEEMLETYAKTHFTNPKFNEKSGIWYEILAEPTDISYQYVISNGGFVTPTVELMYTGKLMNGTIFDASPEKVTWKINYGNLIPAFPYSFFPETVVMGGETYYTGLVKDGLKKGHKIRFIAPSPLCYDNVPQYDKDKNLKIPKDSPLDFTIEVFSIK